MARFVGLDVSQKLTSICVVDDAGRRLWRGQCHSEPEPIERAVRRHAGDDASIGIETGPMTPWLVHELRGRGLNVVCLDARHASAALKMQMNKTDQNDAEGLAQIMRTGWYRSVHVKSLDAHRTRALLGARAQLVGMTTRLSNHIRGVLKTFGMLPGAMRGVPFDRRVEALLADHGDVAAIVRPMLTAWRQLREQIAVFDKAVRTLAKNDPTCRLLMSVPGIGVVTVLAYVSTIEDPARFARSRSVGAHIGLTPRQYQSRTELPGRHVTIQQQRLFMKFRRHHPQHIAAAKAGFSDANRPPHGEHRHLAVPPTAVCSRRVADPFDGLWDHEIRPMLEAHTGLRPVALLAGANVLLRAVLETDQRVAERVEAADCGGLDFWLIPVT